MKTNRHHNIPISICGRDVSSNIIVVTCEDHKLIHETLDLPYRKIRAYRKVMNESFIPGARQVKAQEKIELMFFSRAKFLPPRLQKKILDKLREEARSLYKKYNMPYPKHKPGGKCQDEIDAVIKKRAALFMELVNKKATVEVAPQAI